MDIDTTVSFHLAKDSLASQLFAGYFAKPQPTSHTEQRHVVVRDRNLSYRFTAHYHAWATELTRRLLVGSTSGLQAADTEYRLRVITAAVTTASGDSNGDGASTVTIAAGELLVLPDELTISAAGGAQLHVAGRHLVAADGTAVAASPGDVVVIPAKTSVTRSDRSRAVLLTDVSATLVDGPPRATLLREIFDAYVPNAGLVPDTAMSPQPVEDLDFSSGGAYSVYNWELFFHVPFTIAVNLSRSGHFDDAMRWFHLLFDPTDASGQISPERYWRVKPFQTTEVQSIQRLLVNLSTGDDPALQRDTINAIQAWKDSPFRPHVAARFRPSAYMFKTVMAYIDNLIAWADALYLQDTGETIDEALQLYVLAAVILGPFPQVTPSRGSVRTQNYATLRAGLDEFGNTMRDVEGSLLFDLAPRPADSGAAAGLASVRSIGRSLYFGVPRNDKLLGYWDTVADRLFKIRNSLNLQGVFRQLPLFEPPIDPAMLAAPAAAAGLDTSAIVAGTSQRLPLVRFTLLHRQATELAQQVASLGAGLLAAIEKEDGEALTLIRSRHEQSLATLSEQIKYGQFQEAIKSREAVVGSLNTAVTRYVYYEQQLGRALADIAIPQLDELDIKALAAFNLKVEEPTVAPRDVPIDIARDVISAASGRMLSSFEAEELDLLSSARTIQDVIKIAQLAGQGVSMIPDFGVKFHFWGLGGDFGFGGTQLAKFARFAADIATAVADDMTFQAGVASKVGGYARREQDWAQQSNLAAAEIGQIFKQMRAAQLREAIAEREWRNHQVQMTQLAEIEQFLNAEGANPKGKVANKAMYAWLKREVRALYSRAFALATEQATKAQIALQHEIGDQKLTFVGTNYLAGNEGLLAGEKLLLDLKRMEIAYHENNVREFEMTKHISLAQLNPLQLITLRATGRCTFEIPEELFDLDGPGHYFRRIRSVAVSVPCVAGPYTSINCTLRLDKSFIRRDPAIDGPPEEVHGATESIVASSGAQDGGVFDASGADGRRLPFELSGAISNWILELPGQTTDGYRTFDYDTISDVILHMRFTAREGARKKAMERLKKLSSGGGGDAARVRLFSLRHEFPNAWAAFVATPGPSAPITITLQRGMFPYWSASRISSIETVRLYRPPAQPGGELETLDAPNGAALPKLGVPWTWSLDPASRDVWLLATWKA